MFLFHKLFKKAKCESRAGAYPSGHIEDAVSGLSHRRLGTSGRGSFSFTQLNFTASLLSPGSVHLQDKYLQRKKKKTEQAGSTKMMLVHGQEWNTFRVSAQENTTRQFNVCVLDDFKPNGDRKWRSQSKAAECVNRQDLQRSTIYTDNWSSPQW